MTQGLLKPCKMNSSCFTTFDSVNYFFSAAQSTTFISKKHYRQSSHTESWAQAMQTSEKLYGKINPEIEPPDNHKSFYFQKPFDLIKQIEESIKPYRARII